jgi:hypothetical protein
LDGDREPCVLGDDEDKGTANHLAVPSIASPQGGNPYALLPLTLFSFSYP